MKQSLLLATSIAAAGILLSPGVAFASTAYIYGASSSAPAAAQSGDDENQGDNLNQGCAPQYSMDNEQGSCCEDQQFADVNQEYCDQFNMGDIIPGIPNLPFV